MGSAIFFDLVKDKTIHGFDPANVVTLMTSPLTGTLVPAASGRIEMQGIGVQSHPIGWFTRSNFGGRFSTHLKHAGWDGIVLEGRANKPVWIDIRDDNVAIRDCAPLSLWGKDTWECQRAIWKYVAAGQAYGDWVSPNGKLERQTTQRPAVVAIGPAGERLSRCACLIHDAGNASGQGGFGAVWGSKKLKAISVIGTGGVHIADPRGLLRARLHQKKHYAFDLNDLAKANTRHASSPRPKLLWRFPPRTKPEKGKVGPEHFPARPKEGQRPQACVGCHSGCRARYESGLGNEAHCYVTAFYPDAESLEVQRRASDLLNRYALDAQEMCFTLLYLRDLHELGVLGPGKEIDCPLDFAAYGKLEFVEQFVRMISCRNDGLGNHHPFGNDLAEGIVRAAKKWGRLDEDLKTGLLPFPHWGVAVHYDPRVALEWGYGTILGDRDINEHDFNALFWEPTSADFTGTDPPMPAEDAVKLYTDRMEPFQGDRLMLDYSDENMYSTHIAKLVSWHRYYTRFWKQSALFCDMLWPDFVNLYRPDMRGSIGQAEPTFLKAVTGKPFSFRDGIQLGRRIWNLDHAIWTLQGRHRDMVHFAQYIYTEPVKGVLGVLKHFMPGRKDGKWGYFDYGHRHLDREKFETFKTRFYELQGWDPASGYPTRATLTELGLDHVARELEASNKLGEA